MTAILAALGWIILGSVAGLTPNRWHRPIAYSLIAAIPFIAWPIAREQGLLLAILFLGLCAFQLRLLLMHWLKRLVRRVASKKESTSE